MLKICAFHAAMCDEASPGGSDAAVEEVWLWLPLHDICQDQPDCGCSPHHTDTRGTWNIHLLIKRHFIFSIPGPNFSHCDQNQTYELYAVVNHSGDLRRGCYNATIWDDENWFTFHDSRVTLVRLNTFDFWPLCYSYVLHWETFLFYHVVFFPLSTGWLPAIPGG